MTHFLQPANSATASPFWTRCLTLFALVLILFASSAQAAHIHGDFLPHHDHQAAAKTASSLLADDEASCPLCVAMHSALAAQSSFHTTIQLPVTSAAVEVLTRGSSPDWHFTQFSRPPPSSTL